MQRIFLRTSLFLLSLFVTLGQSEFRLELVQVVIRHGQRTPVDKEMRVYPKNPYKVEFFEPWGGLSQLTNEGKMTEYKIGKMLRQRYKNFLGSTYYSQDIYAISSDFDRTKMSLQLVLAGLYPPDKTQLWNPDLYWIPIPINYIPMKLDMTLLSDECPLYQAILKEVRNMKEVTDKVAIYKDFMKFLSEKTGATMNDTLSVYNLYGLLTAQKYMNLTTPEWCTDVVYRKLQDIAILEEEILSYTPELKRLNSGNLIKKLIQNMNVNNSIIQNTNVKDGSANHRKMYLYSSHDSNIAGFRIFHNISEPRSTNYGSAYIFEKLQDENGQFFIRILAWTGVNETLIRIKLPSCKAFCPLETYLKLVRDMIPSDQESNCLWDNITKEELLKLYDSEINESIN